MNEELKEKTNWIKIKLEKCIHPRVTLRDGDQMRIVTDYGLVQLCAILSLKLISQYIQLKNQSYYRFVC